MPSASADFSCTMRLDKALHGHVHIGKPCLELTDATGILQPRQLLCPLERLPAKSQIDRHRLFHQQAGRFARPGR